MSYDDVTLVVTLRFPAVLPRAGGDDPTPAAAIAVAGYGAWGHPVLCIGIRNRGLRVTVMRGEAATGVDVGLEAGSEARTLEGLASRLRAGRVRG